MTWRESLDLPETGGIVVSRGIVQSMGVSSNDVARIVGQTVEAVLRTSRGETQSIALRVSGVSDERARTVQVSPADKIAMKSWWFNSTNVLESEGYDFVTIRAADVSRARELTAELRKEGFQVQSLELFVEV